MPLPPPETDIEHALRLAARIALERIEQERDTPVLPAIEPAALARGLDLAIPRERRTLDALADDLRAVLRATPITTSRRFFNQLFGGREASATLADMLVAVANTSMYTWKIAAPNVLIERELIRHMCAKVGYASAEGLFCPGGSMSNLAAMVVARDQALPEAREAGLGGAPLRAYTSASSHYSITKAAGLAGVGRGNVRKIPVDDAGRMIPAALRDAIARDRAEGATPFFINATAGTTVEGAIDPIADLADVARDAGVWLHVDAAYGGAALLSQRHRNLLDGADRADSFTWDAHKMMGVPLTCSVALFRESGILDRRFAEPAEYLYQDEFDEFNPGRRSLQCGRRNDALKLWAAWRCLGDEGYEQRVDRQFALARFAAEIVKRDPDLALILSPQLLNVCFEVEGARSEAICDRLHREGRVMVGWGDVNNRRVVRAAFIDPDMTEVDVDAFFAAVKSARSALRSSAAAPTPSCAPG